MSQIGARKRVELRAKHASLTGDFAYWMELTQDGFGIHSSQLSGLLDGKTGALAKLAASLAADVEGLDKLTPADLLQAARPIEKMLLALHCLWGFFREKLAQRLDSETRGFLDAADELAWRCYEPAMITAKARREPPLVFLNGEQSPFMVSRGARWKADGILGDFVSDPGFAEVLESLPIPIIGLPFAQVTHLPELIFVAHETGHAVEDDFDLNGVLKKALQKELAASPHLASWENWLGECFADAWAVAHTGAAYVGSLQDFLAPDHKRPGETLYPPVALRLRLARDLATEMGFEKEAEDLEKQWADGNLTNTILPEDDDREKVVAVLLKTPLLDGQNAKTLGGSDTRRSDATDAANKALGDLAIPNSDARTLVAALRQCYDRRPEKFDLPNKKGKQPDPKSLSYAFLARLKPSDKVRSARSGVSTTPDLYTHLKTLLADRDDV